MPQGYEVNGPNGERGWWDGKNITLLDSNGLKAAPGGGNAAPDPQAQFEDARQTLKLIDDAKGKVNWFSTGQLGRWGRGERTDQGRKGGWGGSPGYELEESFMPLRARIKLQNAAAAKSQGVSLAPMSNSDAASLEATLGSLDVGRDQDAIKATLGDVRETTIKRQKGLAAVNPYDLSRDTPATVPQGALFRGPDGKLYRNTRGAGFPGRSSGPPAGAGQVVSVRTPEEAARLKPGTPFRTPDNQVRTRK